MASAAGTVSASGGFDAEYAYGLPFGYIIFSVAQNTQWSITGNAWGNTLAVGSGISQSEYLFRFQKYLNNNIFLVNQSNQSLNGIGNYNDTLNFGGVLPPATYICEYRTFSQHGGSIFSPPVFGTASSGYNLTLTLTAVPEPATLTLTPLRRHRPQPPAPPGVMWTLQRVRAHYQPTSHRVSALATATPLVRRHSRSAMPTATRCQKTLVRTRCEPTTCDPTFAVAKNFA